MMLRALLLSSRGGLAMRVNSAHPSMTLCEFMTIVFACSFIMHSFVVHYSRVGNIDLAVTASGYTDVQQSLEEVQCESIHIFTLLLQVYDEETSSTDGEEEETERSSESVDCEKESETKSESDEDGLEHDEESEEDDKTEEDDQTEQDEQPVLRLENKQYRPHRDAESTCSTVTSTTRSYLHESNEHVVRKLVRKSVDKRHKQLQRMARGKKGAKPPTPAGRRNKKGNRTHLKELSSDW